MVITMNLKSAISFGLVHIPVTINTAIKNNDTAFNHIHKKCGTRIKHQKFCPDCKKNLEQTDIIKGYEYKNDEYVTFDEEDFKKLKAEGDKIIEIIAFINQNEIDPVYYEKTYVLGTTKDTKAFSLFKTALKKAGKVAIAKTYLRDKSYYVVLRFGYNNIIMNTLYYEEEIKIMEENETTDFKKEELDLALKLIDNLTDKFKPDTYKDEYQDRIKDAIKEKIKGHEVKEVKVKKQKSVSDLMQALELSLKGNKA